MTDMECANTILSRRPIDALNRVLEDSFGDNYIPLNDMHNQWLKRMIYWPDDYTLLAHRGSRKTTVLMGAMAFTCILFPHLTTLFVRGSDDDAKLVMDGTRNILCHDYVKELGKMIHGEELKLTTNNALQISTSYFVGKTGQPQILGRGKKAPTGKHADIIRTDDICTQLDRFSYAERERTKALYEELQPVKNKGGKIHNGCTIHHPYDCVTLLMPNKDVYTVHDTGLYTEEEIEELRKTTSPVKFAADYLLTHVSDDLLVFKTARPYTSDDSLVMGGASHLDIAFGGEDSTALTIANKRDGKIYVFGKLYKESVYQKIGDILYWWRHFMAKPFHYEKNSDGGGRLKLEIESQGAECFDPYPVNTNKASRINGLLPDWENIIFHKDTDFEYIAQIMDWFDGSTVDDAPDSLSSLLQRLDGSKGTITTLGYGRRII